MLLVSGRVVFYGEAAAALRYFQALGLRCPPHTNPADFFHSLCDQSDEPRLPGSPTGEKRGLSNLLAPHQSRWHGPPHTHRH